MEAAITHQDFITMVSKLSIRRGAVISMERLSDDTWKIRISEHSENEKITVPILIRLYTDDAPTISYIDYEDRTFQKTRPLDDLIGKTLLFSPKPDGTKSA